MSESESIGIRELRQHASRYVAMAKAGQRIAVTDRGELVAYLVPADEPITTFQRMVAAGQVTPATGNILDHLPPTLPSPGNAPCRRCSRRCATRNAIDLPRHLGLLQAGQGRRAEGPALRAYLGTATSGRLVSSTLLAVEARRGALRTSPRNLPRVDLLLADVVRIAMSDVVVEEASRLPDPFLRSLDAIHLATALLIREDVDALLTYDDRLATAARAHGIDVAAPG